MGPVLMDNPPTAPTAWVIGPTGQWSQCPAPWGEDGPVRWALAFKTERPVMRRPGGLGDPQVSVYAMRPGPGLSSPEAGFVALVSLGELSFPYPPNAVVLLSGLPALAHFGAWCDAMSNPRRLYVRGSVAVVDE
jgi:hypothetical protein